MQAYWYLDLGNPAEPASTRMLFNPASRLTVGILNFFTLLTLYSTLIPISLYVSIEIIKYFQVSICCYSFLACHGSPQKGLAVGLVKARSV